MEKFDKFNPEEENVRSWLGRFKEMLVLMAIEDDKKVLWLKHALGKEHRNALSGLEDDATLADAEQAIINTYGAANEEREAQDRLQALTQGTLTLQSLSLRARHLANTAFQGSPEATREQQAISAFLKAIPRKLAREVERTPPTSLEAVRREAERQERLIREDEEAGAHVRAVQTTSPPNRGACFLCGEPGHFKRDCPHRRKPQPGRLAGRTLRPSLPPSSRAPLATRMMPPPAWMGQWGYNPLPTPWGPAAPWQWSQPWFPSQPSRSRTGAPGYRGLRAIMPSPGQEEKPEPAGKEEESVVEPIRIEEAVETLNF